MQPPSSETFRRVLVASLLLLWMTEKTDSQDAGKVERRYACWGSFGPPVVSAQCPRGTVIHVVKAGLKVQSHGGMCAYSEEDCGCIFGELGCNMANVRDMCMGQSACRLDVTQQYINTDRCRGFSDYMYIDFHCKPEEETKIVDTCSNMVASSSNGFLRSPSAPLPDNQRVCSCTLKPQTPGRISLRVLDYHSKDDDCQHNKLDITIGGMLQTICSSSFNIRQKLVSEDSIQLSFESDGTDKEEGFWIKYEGQESGVQIQCTETTKEARKLSTTAPEAPEPSTEKPRYTAKPARRRTRPSSRPSTTLPTRTENTPDTENTKTSWWWRYTMDKNDAVTKPESPRWFEEFEEPTDVPEPMTETAEQTTTPSVAPSLHEMDKTSGRVAKGKLANGASHMHDIPQHQGKLNPSNNEATLPNHIMPSRNTIGSHDEPGPELSKPHQHASEPSRPGNQENHPNSPLHVNEVSWDRMLINNVFDMDLIRSTESSQSHSIDNDNDRSLTNRLGKEAEVNVGETSIFQRDSAQKMSLSSEQSKAANNADLFSVTPDFMASQPIRFTTTDSHTVGTHTIDYIQTSTPRLHSAQLDLIKSRIAQNQDEFAKLEGIQSSNGEEIQSDYMKSTERKAQWVDTDRKHKPLDEIFLPNLSTIAPADPTLNNPVGRPHSEPFIQYSSDIKQTLQSIKHPPIHMANGLGQDNAGVNVPGNLHPGSPQLHSNNQLMMEGNTVHTLYPTLIPRQQYNHQNMRPQWPPRIIPKFDPKTSITNYQPTSRSPYHHAPPRVDPVPLHEFKDPSGSKLNGREWYPSGGRQRNNLNSPPKMNKNYISVLPDINDKGPQIVISKKGQYSSKIDNKNHEAKVTVQPPMNVGFNTVNANIGGNLPDLDLNVGNRANLVNSRKETQYSKADKNKKHKLMSENQPDSTSEYTRKPSEKVRDETNSLEDTPSKYASTNQGRKYVSKTEVNINVHGDDVDAFHPVYQYKPHAPGEPRNGKKTQGTGNHVNAFGDDGGQAGMDSPWQKRYPPQPGRRPPRPGNNPPQRRLNPPQNEHAGRRGNVHTRRPGRIEGRARPQGPFGRKSSSKSGKSGSEENRYDRRGQREKVRARRPGLSAVQAQTPSVNSHTVTTRHIPDTEYTPPTASLPNGPPEGKASDRTAQKDDEVFSHSRKNGRPPPAGYGNGNGLHGTYDNHRPNHNHKGESITVTIIAACVIGSILLIVIIGIVVRFVINRADPNYAMRQHHKKECVMRRNSHMQRRGF